eukprot:4714646-Prymnesium_polylepis.2
MGAWRDARGVRGGEGRRRSFRRRSARGGRGRLRREVKRARPLAAAACGGHGGRGARLDSGLLVALPRGAHRPRLQQQRGERALLGLEERLLFLVQQRRPHAVERARGPAIAGERRARWRARGQRGRR